MATKQFYATGDFKYGTRMLRAGDGPVSMDAPTARLYRALGKISADKPLKGTGGLHEALTGEAPTELTGLSAALNGPKPQRAPRKRTAKKSK